MKNILSLFFLGITGITWGQNLILDPGAETDPTTSGWVSVAGYWVSSAQVTPHGGSYHFYAGGSAVSGETYELYQDVNVSAYAGSIDAGTATFNFSVWMRSYSYNFITGYNDKGRVYVEYRDASSAVLSTYDTGNQGSTSWINYTDSRTAPVGTRTIRIRLVTTSSVGTDADGYFDDLSLTTTSSMPVDLLSFTSWVSGDAIELQWTTASETSNQYFTIEKSLDGISWTVIAVEKGANNVQQLSSYNTTDKDAVTGVQYYRLKQTDYDGTTSSFPVIAQVFSEEIQDMEIYPNPASDRATVYIQNDQAKSLRILSLSGQILWVSPVYIENEFTFDLDTLSSGTYLVELTTDRGIQRSILIKE